MNTVTIFFDRNRQSVSAVSSFNGVEITLTDETNTNMFMRDRLTPNQVLRRAVRLQNILREPVKIIRQYK